MKFKFKALVAALALAAVAGQAAAVDTTVAGGSDYLFYAYDTVAGDSFIMNLGNAGSLPSSLSISVAGTAWNGYKAADVNWAANTQWGIVAAGTGASTWVTSTVQNGALTSGFSNVGVANAASQVQTVFNATTAGTYGVSQQTAGSANIIGTYFVDGSGNSAYGANIFNANNAIGATAAIDTITMTSGRGAVPSNNLYTQTVSFDGTSVSSVGAVPEPESYAMLVSGLMLLGAIVRRRKA